MFVHLHCHDEYSILDGFGTAKAYAERAKFLNQPALASTNHGNIDGLLKHQRACIVAGVKPILGCELYVVPNPTIKQPGEHRGHMVVLVRNEDGYKGLCTLLSRANIEGFYHRPRVGFDWFEQLPIEQFHGLIFMTGCLASFVRMPGGQELFNWLALSGYIYLEVMPWPSKEQVGWNKQCQQLSDKTGVPLIATNDCHYILPDDAKAQEVLLAIQRKVKWDDPKRWRFEHEGLHLRAEREMARAFYKHGSLPEPIYRAAMERTVEVADLCNFMIPKMPINLPGHNIDQEAEFGERINRGIYAKFQGNKITSEHSARLAEEMIIIREKKFIPYFIVVARFCDWCREQGIMIGPGRGSVGGSLVAYCMGITDVDPLQYDLLFSRFISPDRNDYPDIDLDIEASRRDEARRYLEDAYGLDNVAGVSTFNRMKGRAVIRDVARVFDVPLKEVDEFAKSIPQEKGDNLVRAAAEKTAGGQAFARKYPLVVDMAQRLEGQVRGAGQHPAALIISADSLVTGGRSVVIERDGTRVINWDMEDSEHVGLMKLDALRLETLTIINECLLNISDGIPEGLDLKTLQMDDQEVFHVLSRGEVSGVFQLSGYACKKLCIEMGIQSFNDIVAIMALSRPGPMQSGMTPDYIRRKKTGQWNRTKYPQYNNIVEDTYGVLVYQEQVMQVFTDVAGMSAGLADKIRKVIGKKRDAKEFEPYRIQFIDGCKQQKTFSEQEADIFWQGLLEWAQYGFNKSHSVEYGIIAYRTAWLKAKYPIEYLAAFLTYGEESQKVELLQEISRKIKIKLVTPKVKYSDPVKWIVNGEYLHMPFTAIKGVGDKDAKKCKCIKPAGKAGGVLGGFFNLPKTEVKKDGSKLQQILEEIKAFEDDLSSAPPNMSEYFGCEFIVNAVQSIKVIPTPPPKRPRTPSVGPVVRSLPPAPYNPMPQTLETSVRAVVIPKRKM